MLDDLVNLALIGTARAGESAPPVAGPVGEILAALPTTAAESKLLDAVAVLSRHATCGRTPTTADAVPAAAEADPRPPCSARAGELLRQVFSTDAKARRQLLGEWLAHAGGADKQVPPAVIPRLLDHAVGDASVRDAIVTAVGSRGAWLMAMNTCWQFVPAEHDDPAAAWSTGTPPQRTAFARRLRVTDPRRAVELIRSTWAEDDVGERVAFIKAMAVGLTAADEPFLESALDDRSRLVRAEAANLLSRLPGSAHVRRMAAVAGAMLAFSAGQVIVTLPGGFDTEWARDGIGIKAFPAFGEKQSWLWQIVMAVPPSHWSNTWNASPDACLAGLPDDFADLLLAAWDAAAGNHPDPAWAAALLAPAARQGRRPPRVELLDGLPAEAQQRLVADLLRSSIVDADGLARFLHHTRFPFGPTAAEALFDRIDYHAAAGRYDQTVGQVMEAVALRVPPTSHDALAARWSGPSWEPYRRPVDQCLATLKLRRDIQKEFAT